MPTHTTLKAKLFIVNALLGIPGNEAEFLAEIKTQISQLGRFIQQCDPDMIRKIVDHFESSSTPLRKIQVKQKLTTI